MTIRKMHIGNRCKRSSWRTAFFTLSTSIFKKSTSSSSLRKCLQIKLNFIKVDVDACMWFFFSLSNTLLLTTFSYLSLSILLYSHQWWTIYEHLTALLLLLLLLFFVFVLFSYKYATRQLLANMVNILSQ